MIIRKMGHNIYQYKKIRYNKKGGIQISTETIIKVVLTVIILIALWTLTTKLLKIFSPQDVEATSRNFEMLAATIKNMEDEGYFGEYPIYLGKKYSIVGYPSNIDAIGGICVTYNIISPYTNKKPEQCGAGKGGCICLCESMNNFEGVCQENKKVEKCFGIAQLGEDISFIGGKFSDGTGKCDFAFIKGTGDIQNIYLKRNNDIVHFCNKECG